MTKFPSILYHRDTYIERVKPFMRTPIVKVMIGHRRVGKSFILFQLIDLIKSEEKSFFSKIWAFVMPLPATKSRTEQKG